MRQLTAWLQRIIKTCFYSLFLLTPFIFNPGNSELFEMPKMYFIYALTVIIVGAWTAKSVLSGKLIFKRTPLTVPLFLFLVSQSLSFLVSIDQHTSLFGYYSRINGGLLSLLAYSLLYWAYVSNLTSEQVKKSVLYLLASAAIISVWATLEHFGFSPSCLLLKGEFNADCWVQDVQARVFATLGQPNWLAAFLVALIPLSLTFFKNHNYTHLTRGVYFLLPAVLLAATLFTKSRSGLLGLAASLATFVFFLLPQKLFLRLGYLILVILSGIFLWQYNLADCFDLNPDQLSSSVGTESCKIRTIVWKGALDIWSNNPVFGTGPETFAYSYYNYRPVEHNNTSEWELLYNKAHNEYLNFLANTGIVGLLSYLLLIIFSLFYLLKNLNPLTISLLSGYVSILVTNFFGFSISVVNLLFFLYPAMAISLQAPSDQQIAYRRGLTVRSVLLLACTLLATSYTLFTIYNFWQADILYAKADKYGKQGLYSAAAKEVKNALFKRSDEPVYYNELAQNVSYLAVDTFETDASTSAKLVDLALDSSSLALTLSPYNLNFLKNRSLVFTTISLLDPTRITQAIQPLERAIQLAPTDPKIHYNLGVLYQRAGKSKKALEMIKRALDLKPDYQDAREALQELQSR